MEDATSAKAEADAREKKSTDLTQASKEKIAKTKQVFSQKISYQRKQAKKNEKRRRNQRQNANAKAKAAQTSRNVTQAVKGTVDLVKQVARTVKNKQRNSTPSP